MFHPRLWPETARIDPRANPAKDAIAVYLLELEIPVPVLLMPAYLSYLGNAEGERWRSIRTAERQWQYLQSRVLRRVVLGAYTERDPAQLHFARDDWGRTRLADHGALHFSLTQCASHVAIAVGSDAVLGIDAETIFPVRPRFMHIARAYFSSGDLAQLMSGPERHRYHSFLELWTLKQAYLKALEPGLHRQMAHCSFARASGGLLVCQDQAPEPGRAVPTSFYSERWSNSCQLALAYRAGLPVSFRYLNGNNMGQVWPHTQFGNGAPFHPAHEGPPLSS